MSDDRPFPPFDDSRRLTGPNLHFAGPGAVLETLGPRPADAQLAGWRERVRAMQSTLGWPHAPIDARRHASGAALAFAAPLDQLFCATEVNEWAWLAALRDTQSEAATPVHADAGRTASHDDRFGLPIPARDADAHPHAHESGAFHAPGHPAAWDDAAATQTLIRYSTSERRPDLISLRDAATQHRLRLLLDDEAATLGGGDGARTWPLSQLPRTDAIDWTALHDIPVALVTGSNGKTTTVRLIAAMLRAHGLRCAWTCTDGLFFDGTRLDAGDYSGPGGAREVLRHPQAQAAVLETARGGLLRRGLALDRAEVAVITNISVDHFGEYGIHDLDGLADTKLIVARALHGASPLVLNADDEVLARRAPRDATLAWFALEHAHPRLLEHRGRGGATCGIGDGILLLHAHGITQPLGPVDAMPLSFDGSARYNLANIAAAALAAAALGIAPWTIARVLASFGRERGDNPGRLQHWNLDGVAVFVDYAHNVDGLRGLLQVATTQRARHGRLGLLLGQAGNRGDAEIRELADVVAEFAPERVVLKDLVRMLRGRAPGTVPTLLRAALQQRGFDDETVHLCLDETQAAQELLGWARAGDVVVLPLHAPGARDAIVAWLERASSATS
jgi:cyanophycin synthetase